MSYSIDHIINECISDKINVSHGSRGTTVGEKNEIYWETWHALNAWIESILVKKKVGIL